MARALQKETPEKMSFKNSKGAIVHVEHYESAKWNGKQKWGLRFDSSNVLHCAFTSPQDALKFASYKLRGSQQYFDWERVT